MAPACLLPPAYTCPPPLLPPFPAPGLLLRGNPVLLLAQLLLLAMLPPRLELQIADDQVVCCKMNPVNEYLGPFIR